MISLLLLLYKAVSTTVLIITTGMTSALRWAAVRAILMFHNCEGQSIATGIYIISLFPHLHPPFAPSLISLMVSVDVKHHVYLLTYSTYILPVVFSWTIPPTHTSWYVCVCMWGGGGGGANWPLLVSLIFFFLIFFFSLLGVKNSTTTTSELLSISIN